MRNKLYNYRMNAIVINLYDQNACVKLFLTNIDGKINEHEEYILKINDKLIRALSLNLLSIEEEKNSLLTRFGFRFASFD
jgi:hypothetical protein